MQHLRDLKHNPIFPKGPEYEKNINTLSMHGEKKYQLQKQRQHLIPSPILALT